MSYNLSAVAQRKPNYGNVTLEQVNISGSLNLPNNSNASPSTALLATNMYYNVALTISLSAPFWTTTQTIPCFFYKIGNMCTFTLGRINKVTDNATPGTITCTLPNYMLARITNGMNKLFTIKDNATTYQNAVITFTNTGFTIYKDVAAGNFGGGGGTAIDSLSEQSFTYMSLN